MATNRRRLYIPAKRFRGQTWHLTEARRANQVFSMLGASVKVPRDRQFLSWYKSRALEHVDYDYSASKLLKACGAKPRQSFVQVSVCQDQILLVELLVLASNGECYDSNECRAKNLKRFPTPEKIAAMCAEFRKTRPRSGYQQIWCGSEGTSIREIGIREIFDANS